MVAPMVGLVAALFTRMSRAPSCSTHAATHAAAWSGSPALAANVASRAPGVAARIAAAASSRPPCLRDDSITAAPASAKDAGDGPPDALRRAGDQRDLTGEFCAPRTAVSRATMGRWPEWQHRTESRPSTHLPRLGYIPALDGLRALAVVAVLLYHADQNWIPGGFLGVDVFFVISGYLITCLLLSDWQQTNGIGLRRFWYRRARRLLPGALRHARRGVALRDPLPPRRARPAPRRGRSPRCSTSRTGSSSSATSRTSRARVARRCCSTCGRSRSRSSSTCSGRSS